MYLNQKREESLRTLELTFLGHVLFVYLAVVVVAAVVVVVAAAVAPVVIVVVAAAAAVVVVCLFVGVFFWGGGGVKRLGLVFSFFFLFAIYSRR